MPKRSSRGTKLDVSINYFGTIEDRKKEKQEQAISMADKTRKVAMEQIESSAWGRKYNEDRAKAIAFRALQEAEEANRLLDNEASERLHDMDIYMEKELQKIKEKHDIIRDEPFSEWEMNEIQLIEEFQMRELAFECDSGWFVECENCYENRHSVDCRCRQKVVYTPSIVYY